MTCSVQNFTRENRSFWNKIKKAVTHPKNCLFWSCCVLRSSSLLLSEPGWGYGALGEPAHGACFWASWKARGQVGASEKVQLGELLTLLGGLEMEWAKHYLCSLMPCSLYFWHIDGPIVFLSCLDPGNGHDLLDHCQEWKYGT